MNRLSRKLSAALMLVVLCIPYVAQAEWVQKEIRWTLSGVTGDGTGIYIRDTTKVVFGGGTTTVDTTGWFSLSYAQPLPRGILAPGISANGYSANDTTVAAYLIIQADSSATPTTTLTSMTLFTDGRAGGFGAPVTLARGWVKVDSIVASSASLYGFNGASDESFAIPLRTMGIYGNIFKWEQLRCRISAATGVLSSARAFIRYWRPSVATVNSN